MNAGNAVGRVGGLALALGVGLGLGLGCAVAVADEVSGAASDTPPSSTASGDAAPDSASPAQSADTSSRATVSSTSSRGSAATPDADPAEVDAVQADIVAPSKTAVKRGPIRIHLPGPAAPSAAGKNRNSKPAPDTVSTPDADSTPAGAVSGDSTFSDPVTLSVDTTAAVAPHAAASTDVGSAPLATAAVSMAADLPSAPGRTADTSRTSTSPQSAPTGLAGVVDNLLAVFGIGPLAAGSPLAPVEAPALWGLLAWARREFQRTFEILGPTSAQTVPTLTTTAVTPMAASTTLAAAATTTPITTAVAWLTGPGTTGPYLLPRTNNTSAMFGIAGTDVGTMWDNGIKDNPLTAVNEHQILTAFGDTFSGTGMTGTWRSNVLLRTSDQNPADGITVPPGVVGDIFSGSPLSAPNFSRQIIKSPGYIGFLGKEVTIIPTAGVSVPYNNAYGARQYVSYMSVKSWDTPGRWTTNYAAIAYSDDNGQTWTVAPSSIRSAGYYRTTTGYVSGNQNFQQSAFVKPPAGSADANYVYVYGTPSGRGGTVYLSRVNQASVLDQTKYEYWNGTSWVLNKPSAATPILPATTSGWWIFTQKSYPSAGEMSVQYNTYLNKYLMMYTDSANNVVMRTADQPQGPWSAPTTLVTSTQYPGLYAPMMDPWTTGQDVYWNMSMWGDYNVLLMHTRLV